MSDSGKLIVITGPGAAGKDAVTKKILEKYPGLRKVVTTASRPPRPGEQEGKDYHFVTKEEFENLIKGNSLLEYVHFSGNYYGTAKEALDPFLEGGSMVWKVEITRGAQIKELFLEHFPNQTEDLMKRTVVIYLDVPDPEILKERLQRRGMSEEVIKQRLEADKKDWETFKSRFANIVINEPGKLDETVEQIDHLIQVATRRVS